MLAPGASYVAPEDSSEISTLRNQAKATIIEYSWRMVFAKDEAEFDQLLKEMQETADGLGYQTVLEFDMNNAKIKTKTDRSSERIWGLIKNKQRIARVICQRFLGKVSIQPLDKQSLKKIDPAPADQSSSLRRKTMIVDKKIVCFYGDSITDSNRNYQAIPAGWSSWGTAMFI